MRSGKRITFFFPGRSIVCREDSRRRPTRSRRSPRLVSIDGRCCCADVFAAGIMRGRVGGEIPILVFRPPLASPLPPVIPPRLLSPLPSRSTGAFRRFYSVCFRAPRSGGKSVGPSASRSIAVSPPVPTIAPNEGSEEGGGRRRDNDKCGGRR